MIFGRPLITPPDFWKTKIQFPFFVKNVFWLSTLLVTKFVAVPFRTSCRMAAACLGLAVWPDRQRLINRTAAHWACPPRPGLARCGVAREGEMQGAFVVCCWTLVSCLALARFLAAIARQWSSDPPCQATQRVRLGLGSSSALRGHHGLVAPLSPINKRESRGDRGPL